MRRARTGVNVHGCEAKPHGGDRAVLKTDEVRQLIADQGAQLVGGEPKEFAGYISSELKKWARIVAEAKLQLD